MKGAESSSDTDHNLALEREEVSVVVPKSLMQATCCLCFRPSRSQVTAQSWQVYELQLYLQRIATLGQRHILGIDVVQKIKPTFSNEVC